MAIIRTDNCINGQFRQGDVLIQEIDEPVEEIAKKQPAERGLVLALGEMSGHAHLIDPATAYEFEGKASRPELGTRFLQVLVDTMLRHEGLGDDPGDHEPIALKAGKRYLVRQQLELDPAGLPVQVRD